MQSTCIVCWKPTRDLRMQILEVTGGLIDMFFQGWLNLREVNLDGTCVIYFVWGLRANGSMVLRLSNGCTQDWSWIGL